MRFIGRFVVHGAIAAFLAAACAISGCASSPKGSGLGASYIDLYRTGQYAAAYSEASRAASDGPAGQREQAALIAGESAHAMNRFDDAERWLAPLVTSRNQRIAGEAGASMGLVAQQRAEHDRAVRYLTTAAPRLTGDDRARAWLYAGDSARLARRAQEAKGYYQNAEQAARDDRTLKATIASRLAGGPVPSYGGQSTSTLGTPAPTPSPVAGSTPRGGWTIQAGAFSTRDRANQHAAGLSGRAASAGLDTPRVVAISDSRGRLLFAVRIGRFATEADARSARARIGGDAVVSRATGE